MKKATTTKKTTFISSSQPVRLTVTIDRQSPAIQGLEADAKKHKHRFPAGWASELIEGYYELFGDDPRKSRLFPELYQIMKDVFASDSHMGVEEKEQKSEEEGISLSALDQKLNGFPL
jgi:hypothetical protein